MSLLNRNIRHSPLLLSLFIMLGCSVHQKANHAQIQVVEDQQLNFGTKASPSALVYKTRKDYFNRVPVQMNSEKDRIVSYPDPTDLLFGDKLALPTRLNKDYLLDNRGIGANVAFLTYTYETYSALSKAPEMSQLMDSLLDKYPLTELWDCGSRYQFKNVIPELNNLIEKGFNNCKALIPVMRITQ